MTAPRLLVSCLAALIAATTLVTAQQTPPAEQAAAPVLRVETPERAVTLALGDELTLTAVARNEAGEIIEDASIIGWCEVAGEAAGSSECFCTFDREDVVGLVAEVARASPLSRLEPPLESATRTAMGVATRTFAGPMQVPPSEYGAYGLVVFKTRPLRLNHDRYLYMCEAYASALASTSEVDVPKNQQMVTVWPVSRDEIANQINPLPGLQACEIAVENYGLVQAQNALAILDSYSESEGIYDTEGRGPYLVAWTPGTSINEPDSVALVIDLSHINDAESALEMMTLWRDKIQNDPELWRSESLKPRLVDVIRRFFDENGAILEALL